MSFLNKPPSFTQERICVFSEAFFKLLEDSGFSKEEISNVSVEVKYKLQPLFSGSVDVSQEGSVVLEPFIRASLVGINCAEGDGPGCGRGWHMVL